MSDSKNDQASTVQGYDAVARSLHWLVLLLLVIQYVVAETMPEVHRNTVPDAMIKLHLSLGLTILLAMAARLVWRLMHPVPLLRDVGPDWQRIAAEATHWLLYLIALTIPVLGWVSASGRNWEIEFFGLFKVMPLVGPDPKIGSKVGDLHCLLSWILIGLVAVHVAAALYHHFLRKDGVLLRMLGK